YVGVKTRWPPGPPVRTPRGSPARLRRARRERSLTQANRPHRVWSDQTFGRTNISILPAPIHRARSADGGRQAPSRSGIDATPREPRQHIIVETGTGAGHAH